MTLAQIVLFILIFVILPCTLFEAYIVITLHRYKTENDTNDEQLDQWMHSTPVINVLTSPQMGAWLERRDKSIAEQTKTGKWVFSSTYNGTDFYKCSNCKEPTVKSLRTPYCPYCGIKMKCEDERCNNRK